MGPRMGWPWQELIWDGLLLAVVTIHLFLTPFTKVEESFNLQACHDALLHGTNLREWDHLQFPGAVPRTFLGSIVVSALVFPVRLVLGIPSSSSSLLRLVRFMLGFLSVAAFARLRRAVALEFGLQASRALAVITFFQFHLPFYMSRTLPNVFALQLATLAHAHLVAGSGYRCLVLLGLAAAVFRCDLLVLIAPVGLLLLWQRRVDFFKAAAATALAALLGAVASVSVDSVLWQRWLWPEFEVLWFNTAENKSSDWGTLPPLWYFYSALPKALLGAAPLLLLAVIVEPRARQLVLVPLTFVALYSFLPHKELRFIFPALPLLNAVAATAVARALRWKGLWRSLAVLGLMGLALSTLLVTATMTVASFLNYPGGVALTGLQVMECNSSQPLAIHIGNLAAISGVSRFLQDRQDWQYSKEENLAPQALATKGFDRLLSEFPEVPGYECIAVVEGFQRMRLQAKWPPVGALVAPQVYVLSKSEAGRTIACSDEMHPKWSASLRPDFQFLHSLSPSCP